VINKTRVKWYETVSYTQTFRGAYAAYAVTVPVAAANSAAAEAFVRLLLSEKGMTMFERAGFQRFDELRVLGDHAAVPESLRPLDHGQAR
jgi:ABC-type molybdate transport system substrate-binding protein